MKLSRGFCGQAGTLTPTLSRKRERERAGVRGVPQSRPAEIHRIQEARWESCEAPTKSGTGREAGGIGLSRPSQHPENDKAGTRPALSMQLVLTDDYFLSAMT